MDDLADLLAHLDNEGLHDAVGLVHAEILRRAERETGQAREWFMAAHADIKHVQGTLAFTFAEDAWPIPRQAAAPGICARSRIRG